VQIFDGLHQQLLAEEKRHADWHEGMAAAGQMLQSVVDQKKVSYDEFIFSV
jgi:hypothetical protein